MEIEDLTVSEDIRDNSLQLLHNIFNTEHPKVRGERSFNISKSGIEDAFQSTRSKVPKLSPQIDYETGMSLTRMPDDVVKQNNSNVFESGQFLNPVAKSAQDQLFGDFMEACQRANSSEQDLFTCLLEYIQYCTDAIDMIRGSEQRSLTSLSALDRKRLAELESEKTTWRLIYSLYQNRIISSVDIEDENMDTDLDLMENVSEKEIVQQLFKMDSTVREWQLVIDWLEGNAKEVSVGAGLEEYTDKGVMWENTLLELRGKRSVPFRSTRELVAELDPDAPRRQNRHLHDMDQDDEDRLTQHVFREIRCGRLDEAQALCVHAGQPWRAAILEGWNLFHDPNYSKVQNRVNRETLPVEGNPHRDIWKLCAWRMCEDGKMGLRARAAVGAYCGHLPTLVAMASTWEDHLWAYLKTMVDIRVEQEIRNCSFKTYVEMPPKYWNNEMNIEAVFKEISANRDRAIRKEALAPDHVVHRAVIMDNVQLLKDDISSWISGSDMSVGNDSEAVSPHFLRFLAHFVLFLRQIGRSGVDAIADPVIEAYVKLLSEKRECDLVAWYVSQLGPEDQIYYYAAFLEELTEAEDRERALNAALNAGLNIDLITKTVVENKRQQPCNVDSAGLEIQEVSAEDSDKISALDWLLFLPSQRTELLVQANALIAFFLASGNVFAARKAFNKIPEEVIGQIQPQQSVLEDNYLNLLMNNVSKTVALATKEYLCYKAYLDADESFSDWFQYFHHAKPVEPILQSGYTFIEKVGFQHKHNQYKADLERWQLAMDNQTVTTKKLLMNVVTFPCGWLVDEDQDEPERTEQLHSLRSVILPKVTFLLHLVMHSMRDYAGCVTLADLIASNHGNLYKVFNKQRLQDLLQKIAESSMALMNEGKDPWGFPSN